MTEQLVTLARQRFASRQVGLLRRLVTWAARRAGLDREREHDFVLAVAEAAGNAIRHGGGHGRLNLMQDDGRTLIAEVSDDGPGIVCESPVALPDVDRSNGRGLYLIHQTCDRVELRTSPDGTTVHMEVDLPERHAAG